MEKLKSTGYENTILKIREDRRNCPLEAACLFFIDGACQCWQEEQEEVITDPFQPE